MQGIPAAAQFLRCVWKAFDIAVALWAFAQIDGRMRLGIDIFRRQGAFGDIHGELVALAQVPRAAELLHRGIDAAGIGDDGGTAHAIDAEAGEIGGLLVTEDALHFMADADFERLEDCRLGGGRAFLRRAQRAPCQRACNDKAAAIEPWHVSPGAFSRPWAAVLRGILHQTRRGFSQKLGDWRLGHVVFGTGKQPQQIGAKAQGRTGRGVIAAEQGAEHAVLGLPVHHTRQ